MKSVILIDDNPRFVEEMSKIIKNHTGFRLVASTNNGREGKLLIQYHRPELVIMDIMMPDDDGLELIRYIQEECRPYNPYIYVITLMKTPSIQRVLNDLAVDFISFKPIVNENILENLEQISQIKTKTKSKSKSKSRLPAQYMSPNKVNLLHTIADLMEELKIPSHLIGNEYIKTALFFMLDDPTMKRNVYKKVAEVFNCSSNNIAANINNAVKACINSELYRDEFGEGKIESLLFLNHLTVILKKRMRVSDIG